MEKLLFVAQLEQSLVDKMHSETIEAMTSNRKPFLFVELSSKEVIPVWLTPELSVANCVKRTSSFKALTKSAVSPSWARL